MSSKMLDACPAPNGNVFISEDDTDDTSSIREYETVGSSTGLSKSQYEAQQTRMRELKTIAATSHDGRPSRSAAPVRDQSTPRSEMITTAVSPINATIRAARPTLGDTIGHRF